MKYLRLTILLVIVGTLSVRVTHAQTMKNSSYILDLSNNPAQQTNTATPTETDNTNVVTLSKTISGDNFISTLSYDTDTKNLPLVLSTSSDLLNFGIIQPGEPVIRTHSLTVLPGSSVGYQVLSYQNHTLEADKDQIPSTTCDNGACTPILPDVWTIPLTYGFGYRCDNLKSNACDPELKKDYYKSFANEKANVSPASLLEEDRSVTSQAVITYKINVPGNQANKEYHVTIYHIAIPNL